MSRHQDLESINCCASSGAVSVDWSQFLAPGSASPSLPSPIDEFYEAQKSLAKLSALVGPSLAPDAAQLLAGQVLLGYVSATELYLRRSIAKMVKLCPYVRAGVRSQTIPFGALDYYGTIGVEHALTEQVSFTEAGKIRNQIQQKMDVIVQANTSLEQSIADFERLAQLRHALVHAHGVLTSTNAADFSGNSGVAGARRTEIDTDCLGWVSAVTLNLVRDINTEVVRSTVWRWLRNGYIGVDRRATRAKIAKLLDAFGSQQDAARTGGTPLDVTHVTDVAMRVGPSLKV